MFSPFERRMIAHVVGCVAVRRLPQQIAAIEIDCRDQAMRQPDGRRGPARSTVEAATRVPAARARWAGQIVARAIPGIGGTAVAGSPGLAERRARDSATYRIVENSRRRPASSAVIAALATGAYAMCVSGS